MVFRRSPNLVALSGLTVNGCFYRDSDVFLLFVSWPLPGIRPSCSMFSFTLVSHNVRILRFFSSSAFQLDALRVTRGNNCPCLRHVEKSLLPGLHPYLLTAEPAWQPALSVCQAYDQFRPHIESR